jgi:ElaB/YqjD/DUF883 family membrane-anchored ribosome-binding protein
MNETIASSFPQTRQELTNLKHTAVDAAKDIGSTASVHSRKVQGNLENLAANAQREGGEQLSQVKTSLADVGQQVREFLAARPLAAIGTALVVGFLLGLSRSHRTR